MLGFLRRLSLIHDCLVSNYAKALPKGTLVSYDFGASFGAISPVGLFN